MSEMRSELGETGDEGDIMNTMLPTLERDAVSLADVVPSCLFALGWSSIAGRIELPQTKSVVLVVIDGLGSRNIENGASYGRFLAAKLRESTSIQTVFPSTTASALSSLVTGVAPGHHGICGYRIWNPQRGEHVNQLNGVSAADIDSGWLRSPSLIASHAEAGRAVFVAGHARFADSTLTRMLYGSATYLAERTLEDRLAAVRASISSGTHGLYLVYVSDLDEAAHSNGVDSSVWLERLEVVDSVVKKFVTSPPAHTVTVLTADHGVIDVPSTAHTEYGLGPEMDGVLAVGGEPRCLQLKLDGKVEAETVAQAWNASLAGKVDAVAREQVIERLLLGADAGNGSALERAGDVFVFARDETVLYDGRDRLNAARNMIGQHGGLTDTEMTVPLLIWS
jgi:hypothetical protein